MEEDSDFEGDTTKAAAFDNKRKARELNNNSKYISCVFIEGTAVVVERLWSKLNALYGGKRRAGLSPLTIGAILFIHENSDLCLWNINDVVDRADDRKKREEKKSRAQTQNKLQRRRNNRP